MNIKTTHLSDQYQFPMPFLWAVALLCILPILLNFFGVDFSSQAHGFNIKEIAESDIPKSALLDQMFYTLAGGLHHVLLEWSAVIIAYLTILLAFAHFAINKDITAPIIGIALFCSGTMDAFHTLAAMRLIDAVADNSNFIPFTWALSRGFNAGILIIGVLLCLRLKQTTSSRLGLYPILIISLIFGGVAYGLIHYSAISETLPQTQFPDAVITRPYDVIPLVLFCIAAPIFWRLYRTTPNLLTAALLISLLPEIVLEAHMSFGSSHLFDNHFNIAHFLKIFAYLIPFIGLVLDYIRTSQNKVETTQKLEEREQRLQAVMDTAVDGIIAITPLGKITSFNHAAEKIFGYTADEVIGSNIKHLMPEPYQNQHDGYLAAYMNTGKENIIGSGGRELEAMRKDGSIFPIELGVSEVKLKHERSFVGIIRDITVRKDDEEKLKHALRTLEEREQRLQAVMDTAVDGIIAITPLGKITSFNQAAEKIFGYTADEVIGSNIKRLMPEPYQNQHDGYLAAYMNTGKENIIGSGGRELEAMRKDGSIFPIELGVSEVKLKHERSFVGIIRDITVRKDDEEKLKHTLENLTLSNEELEKFAYVASHDLKSPLRAIDNLSLWLDEDLGESLSGKNKEHMEKLRSRVNRMDQLLDDLLNYCRAGQSTTKSPSIMADDLINNISHLLNIPEGFQLKIDESLKNCSIPKSPLDQIFRNLIGNAVKHHDKTEGTVTISMKPDGEFYEFTVEDDGPGIDPRFHDKVFEMFQTLKPRDEVEGSGMGMAMVKKLLFKHGGRITLDSDIGRGARFNFTWPK